MRPDHRATLFKIRRWKTHAKTQHGTVFTVQRHQLFIHLFGRSHPGALGIQCNQVREALHMQRLLAAELYAPLHQLRSQLTSGGHVHMRVGAVGHQAIRFAQHARRHVGVQIQAGHDGHCRAYQLTQSRDQLAFAVVGMFGHSRAMQVEVNPIQALRHCRLRILQNGLRDALESILRDVRRRTGAGPGGGHKLPLPTPCLVDEATHRNVHPGEFVHHRLPAHVSGKSFTGIESCPVGQAGGKGVGLVLVTSDQDARHATPLVGG